MRSHLPIIICLLCGLSALAAAIYPQLTEASARKLVIDPQVVDCGVVRQGAVVTRSVQLRNASTSHVFIDRIESSCDCAIASHKSSDVAGGRSIEVPLTWKIGTSRGSASRRLSVIYSLNGTKLISPITLRATVSPEYSVSPDRLTADRSSNAQWTVSVMPNEAPSIKVLAVRSTHPALEVLDCVESGKGWKIRVKFEKDRWTQGGTAIQSEYHLPTIVLETDNNIAPRMSVPLEFTPTSAPLPRKEASR